MDTPLRSLSLLTVDLVIEARANYTFVFLYAA